MYKNKIHLLVLLIILSVCFSPLFLSSVDGQSKRPRRITEGQSSPAKSAPSSGTTKTETQPPLTPVTAQTVNSGASGGAADPQQQQPPAGQTPKKPVEKAPEPDAEPIKIQTSLVGVPVSVTDVNGNPVRNLRAEDFVLEEDGVAQQLQSLGEPGKSPIELCLLFDVSRSIRNRFDFEREAAGRFLQTVIKPGDAVSVFAIGTTPRLAIPRTENVGNVISGTMSIQPTDDSTAFFDTVVKASRYLSDNAVTGARRVVIVLSDGEDTNSDRFRLGDAQRETQRADTLFYAINPSGPSIRLNRISTKGHEGMVRLATDTGGLAFLPDRIEDLTQVFNQIAAELQAQYLLGYYSTNDKNDGQLRKITVRVPKDPNLRIRARNGYYAPRD